MWSNSSKILTYGCDWGRIYSANERSFTTELEVYFKSIIDADTAAVVVCTSGHEIPVAYFASVNFPGTLCPMGWASALGSLLSVVICVTAYAVLNKKKAVEKLG